MAPLLLFVFLRGLPRPLEPIPVDIECSKTVGDLKEAIFPKIVHSLEHKIDAAALSLYKVDFPDVSDVGELEAVASKAKKEKLLASLKLSSAFTANPPKLTISILAELPQSFDDEPPKKRARLAAQSDIFNDLSADWHGIWATFWGNPSSKHIVEESVRLPDGRTLKPAGDETKYKYLTLPDDGVFPCDLSRVLITNTYRLLYSRLCEEEKVHSETPRAERFIALSHSTIIMGQPGIGKTAGLSCILVWRLQQKKPTVYCNNKAYAFVFTDSGVQQVLLSREWRINFLDQSVDCCGLVDINPELLDVPSHFHPHIRLGRVVVATSPDYDSVKAFKSNVAKTFYLPTWKWADLCCASLLVQPQATELLRDIFQKLGGIPRKCFRAISLDGKEHEMQKIDQAINQISGLQDFMHSESGFMWFDSSHPLLRIEPSDDTWIAPVMELLSDYVARRVFNRIKLFQISLRELRDCIDHPLSI